MVAHGNFVPTSEKLPDLQALLKFAAFVLLALLETSSKAHEFAAVAQCM